MKNNIPLFCPKCRSIMNKRLDKKSWLINESCFDCMIKVDTQKIINGTFKEYEKGIVKGNYNLFLDDITEFAEEYIEQMDKGSYVTQDGKVEKWSHNMSKENMKKYFKERIDKFK